MTKAAHNVTYTILQDSKKTTINYKKELDTIAENLKKLKNNENREMFTYNKYTDAVYYHGFNN